MLNLLNNLNLNLNPNNLKISIISQLFQIPLLILSLWQIRILLQWSMAISSKMFQISLLFQLSLKHIMPNLISRIAAAHLQITIIILLPHLEIFIEEKILNSPDQLHLWMRLKAKTLKVFSQFYSITLTFSRKSSQTFEKGFWNCSTNPKPSPSRSFSKLGAFWWFFQIRGVTLWLKLEQRTIL